MATQPPAVLLAYGNFVFRYRDYLAPLVVLLIVAFTRPHGWGVRWLNGVVDVVGVFLALCGQALRALVIGLAYIQRGGKNKRIAGDRLVISGMFAHCRHPLYVGNFLLFTGLMIIWSSPWALVIGVGLVGLTLFAMASAEEAFLARKFGADYVAYCRRVNRFVPNLHGLWRTIRGFDFDWKRVIRKDYGTTFTWMSTALVLIALKHAILDTPSQALGTATAAAVAWVCVAALWGMARWMKKSRRLVSPD